MRLEFVIIVVIVCFFFFFFKENEEGDGRLGSRLEIRLLWMVRIMRVLGRVMSGNS